MRFFCLTVLLLFVGISNTAARAQGLEQTMDSQILANGWVKEINAQPPPQKSGGLFRSGLAVPTVNPGATARGIGRQLRLAIEQNAGSQAGNLAQIEEGMPAALAALEAQLEQNGFAKRDLGVAVAFAFIYNYETATKKTIPLEQSQAAARSVATAFKNFAQTHYAKLPPAEQEEIYESLITTTLILSSFAQEFEKAGKTAEASGFRQTAAGIFSKLTGASPDKVAVAADGRISGLSANTASAGGAIKNNQTTATLNTSKDSPLSASTLGGAQVFIKYSLSYYPSFTTNFRHLILFPDGTAFDEIPNDPMPQFDAATLRSLLKPRDVGQWKAAGNTIVLTFNGKQRTLKKIAKGWYDGEKLPAKDSPYDTYFPVIAPNAKFMLGAWKNSSLVTSGAMGGGTAMVAAGSSGNMMFNADGTFVSDRKSFASATTANMGDAYKTGGDASVYSKRNNSAAGRWRLDGILLTMEKDGQKSVQIAFIMPNWSKDNPNSDLMIQGDWWKRPEKK